MGFPARTKKEVRSFLGNGVENLMLRSLPDDHKESLHEAVALFREYYGKHSEDETCPYDGIPALLDRLQKEGYGVAVISNKPDFAVQTLSAKYFPAVSFSVGEREGILRKPAPDAIFEALRVLGVSAENSLYVGDSEVDVETGKNAGMPCIAVTWGFRDRDVLEASGAEHYADTAEELYEKIQSLLS